MQELHPEQKGEVHSRQSEEVYETEGNLPEDEAAGGQRPIQHT